MLSTLMGLGLAGGAIALMVLPGALKVLTPVLQLAAELSSGLSNRMLAPPPLASSSLQRMQRSTEALALLKQLQRHISRRLRLV